MGASPLQPVDLKRRGNLALRLASEVGWEQSCGAEP